MQPTGFGIVGCGRISERHFQSIAQVEAARLIAVCDTMFERAETKGKKYAVPYYSSMEAMLDAHNDVDVVSILTPSGYHAEHSLCALRAGRHVLVEKPMALTLDDAEEMILTADTMNRRLFVVKQNRYNKPITKVREFFEEGAFGKMVMGTVRVRWCRRQAYYDQDAWRGTWRWDGGVLSNQASHHIDLLQWFLGEPVRVYATSRTSLVDIEVEDTAAAIIEFRGGAIGIVEATTATRPKDLEGSLSLLGERGSVVIGGFAVNEVTSWHFEGRDDNEDIARELSVHPPDVYGFGHRQIVANVCTSLATNSRGLVESWEGLKSLRLTAALYESIETGRSISLRFSPQRCRLGKES